MTKPYLKLASTFVIVGMALFALERFGLDRLTGPEHTGLKLDPTLLSLLVLAPIVLVAAGCIIFMVGKMRRL